MAGYEPSYMFQEKRIEYDCLVQKKETTPTSYIWKHTQENKLKKKTDYTVLTLKFGKPEVVIGLESASASKSWD